VGNVVATAYVRAGVVVAAGTSSVRHRLVAVVASAREEPAGRWNQALKRVRNRRRTSTMAVCVGRVATG